MHEICLWGKKETLGSHNSRITLFLLVTSRKFWFSSYEKTVNLPATEIKYTVST